MKKILLSLGALSAIALPVAAVVSCGSSSNKKANVVYVKTGSGVNGNSQGPQGTNSDSGGSSTNIGRKHSSSMSLINDNAQEFVLASNINSNAMEIAPEIQAYNLLVSQLKDKTIHVTKMMKALSGDVKASRIKMIFPAFNIPDQTLLPDLKFLASIDRFSRSSTITASLTLKGEKKIFNFSIDNFSKDDDFTAAKAVVANARYDVFENADFGNQEIDSLNKEEVAKKAANILLVKDKSLTSQEASLFINSFSDFMTFKVVNNVVTFTIKIKTQVKQFRATVKMGLIKLANAGSGVIVLHKNDDNSMFTLHAGRYSGFYGYSQYSSSNLIYLTQVSNGQLIEKQISGISSNDFNDKTVFFNDGTTRFIGTSSGVYKLEKNSNRFELVKSIDVSNGFIYKTKSGDLYIGTANDGLKMIDLSGKEYDISSVSVKDGFMFESSKGDLYVGTNSIGLNKINNNGDLISVKFNGNYLIKTDHMKMFETKEGILIVVGKNGLYSSYGKTFAKDSEGIFKPEFSEVEYPAQPKINVGIIDAVSHDSSTLSSAPLYEKYLVTFDNGTIDDIDDFDDIDTTISGIYNGNGVYLVDKNGVISFYSVVTGDCTKMEDVIDKDAQFFVDNNKVEVFANGSLYKITNIL